MWSRVKSRDNNKPTCTKFITNFYNYYNDEFNYSFFVKWPLLRTPHLLVTDSCLAI